jgi:hypothetical protein
MKQIILQQDIITNILKIQDIKILSEIKEFLQTKSPENIYQLSDEEAFVIQKRKKTNNTISNKQVFDEIETWLNEK